MRVDTAKLSATARAVVERYAYPGLAIGVVSGGQLVHADAVGFADIESGRLQDPALRQRIGSITKTMVAMCAMALVDEGRLSLESRLVDLIPELVFHGADPAAVTLRHLLTHTAGIGEVAMPEDIGKVAATFWSDTPHGPSMGLFDGGLTLDVPAGTKWAYANLGYALLGEIVARIEGAPIETALQRRIFEPLGMTNSDMLDRPHPDLTTPYHRAPEADEIELRQRAGQAVEIEPTVDGTNIRGRFMHIWGGAAGAVQSTIPDMARYAAALLDRGGGIVRPETFDAMVGPQWAPDERLESWGLGFHRFERFGRRVYGHGGGMDGGWNTMMLVIPEEDVALLIHANLYAYQAFTHLESALLAALLGGEAPKAGGPVDAAVLAAAPGVYEAPPGRLTNFRINGMTGRLQIKARDDGLTLYARRGDWKGGVALLPADPADPGFFRVDDGALEPTHLALVRDERGAVTGLRYGMLVEMRRTEETPPWA